MHGVIHGKTIELRDNAGITDGQEVKITVSFTNPGRRWGEGIRRSAGGWSDYPEMDAIMARIQKDR